MITLKLNLGRNSYSYEWYHNNNLHRGDDKPAVSYPDGVLSSPIGHQEWWAKGQRHREGDKPALITCSGHQEWHNDGRIHRGGDKPALIASDGSQEWWVKGQRHREGGKPAAIYPDGYQEWWLEDEWLATRTHQGETVCVHTIMDLQSADVSANGVKNEKS